MKLIVITTEKFFDGEAEAINLLFENGLKTLHLRKPSASQLEMEDFIPQINKKFHKKIVIHDHYDLFRKFRLKGRHEKHKDWVASQKAACLEMQRLYKRPHPCIYCYKDSLPPGFNHAFLKFFGTYSKSCHSLEELSMTLHSHYVFLSPIFDSISKIDYYQGFTLEQLREAKEKNIITERVIALGGITAENIPIVRELGFGGVAVLGSLWWDYAVSKDVDKLLQRFNLLKKRCNSK